MKTLRIRFHRPLSILFIAALVLAALWLGKAPAHAQADSNPPLPNGCTCVSQAIELLAKANVPITALKEIILLVAEPDKLTDKLTAAKVDPKAASDLVAALQDLVYNQGLTSGELEIYAVSHALDILDKYKIPSDLLGLIVAAKTTDDAGKVLAKYQVDVAVLLKELQPYKDLGLDETAIGNYWVEAGVAVLAQYDAKAMRGGSDLNGTVLSKWSQQPYNHPALGFGALKKVKKVFTAVASAPAAAASAVAEAVPELAQDADRIVGNIKPLVQALVQTPMPPSGPDEATRVASVNADRVASQINMLTADRIRNTAQKLGIPEDNPTLINWVKQGGESFSDSDIAAIYQARYNHQPSGEDEKIARIRKGLKDLEDSSPDTPADAQQVVTDINADVQQTAQEEAQPIADTSAANAATDDTALTTDASQPESQPVIVDDNQSDNNGDATPSADNGGS